MLPPKKFGLVDLPATDFITEIKATQRTISERGLRESSARMIPANSVIVSTRATIGRIATNRIPIATNQGFKNVIIEDPSRALSEYVALTLTKLVPTMEAWATGGTFKEISKSKFCELQIPLPPLEVQKEIVAEIESYQKVINGARAVLDNYRPHIPIHPDWPSEELGEICAFKRGPFGGSLKKDIFVKSGYAVYEQSHAIANDFSEFRYFVDKEKFHEMRGFQVRPGELIMSCSGTMGKVAIIPENAPPGIINQALLKLTPTDRVLGFFLKLWMESANFQQSLAGFTYGAAIKNVASVEILKGLRLPLPPPATQQAIVAEIGAEQALVAANRELVARFEKKIQATIARAWGQDEPAPAEA